VRHDGLSSNFALCSINVLTNSCANYRTDRECWAEISSQEWHVQLLNTAYSLGICYRYITNIKSNCCVMFTGYHVIQFILHGLIAKLKYFGHKMFVKWILVLNSIKIKTVYNPVYNKQLSLPYSVCYWIGEKCKTLFFIYGYIL